MKVKARRLPVTNEGCPTGKWRIGHGKCVYNSEDDAKTAQRAIHANKDKMGESLQSELAAMIREGGPRQKIVVHTVWEGADPEDIKDLVETAEMMALSINYTSFMPKDKAMIV